MKSKFKLLSGTFILLFLASCTASHVSLLPEDKEQIFSHEVQIKKEDIHIQVIQFFNEKFVSGKSVIQSSEDGLITGNGIFEIYNSYGLLGELLWTAKVELTFLVKYIDNQYKTKFIVKRVFAQAPTGLPTDQVEGVWGRYRDQINNTIKKLDDDLLSYLTKKDDKFKF